MPPDLFGNIAASSAWMLFCMAPREIEIVHRTNAPVVPSAPTDPPRDAIRKAGLHSATTKPSHHVIALRSCLSSTSACAIHPPWFVCGNSPRTNWYRRVRAFLPSRADTVNGFERGVHTVRGAMTKLRDRRQDDVAVPAEPTRARPVVLATLAVRVHPSAERMAIDSAIE